MPPQMSIHSITLPPNAALIGLASEGRIICVIITSDSRGDFGFIGRRYHRSMGDRSPCCTGFVLLLASSLVWTAGCRRQKLPSQEFAAANRLFVRVYGEKLEDAFVDPRMAQVEQLLNEVGVGTADYPGAQELLGRIRTGREKAQKELNARRELMRAANAPVEMTSRWVPRSPVDAGIAEV